ncbi:adenosylcobinamide amidohydrolase [Ochrobactrum sp. CM-21-5]|nr:adenosylcobinamide amidohydrolase [Ochrobactrum sp. CM-21-5]MBC2887175.1 adenosylcobinamide amidohydrolase [Ochrobactrum sp. CM-21-5]
MPYFSIDCSDRVLAANFPDPQTILSWSLTRPGFVTARSVAWLEVRDDDLSIDVDPAKLLTQKLAAAGYGNAVQMMTSRAVGKHHLAERWSGEITAACLATVGLSNAGRVGHALSTTAVAGTINLLVHVNVSLSLAAHIEALSIATAARTAAIMDLGLRVEGRIATGTGTDCIVAAAPLPDPGHKVPASFAGLHTDIGAAIGGAVYEAIAEGGKLWLDERKREIAAL